MYLKDCFLCMCNMTCLVFFIAWAALGVRFNEIMKLSRPMLWNFSHMFSPGFRVSYLTFKSLPPLWFDFCVWCNIKVRFHSFASGYPVFPRLFVEETVLLSCNKIAFVIFFILVVWPQELMFFLMSVWNRKWRSRWTYFFSCRCVWI